MSVQKLQLHVFQIEAADKTYVVPPFNVLNESKVFAGKILNRGHAVLIDQSISR